MQGRISSKSPSKAGPARLTCVAHVPTATEGVPSSAAKDGPDGRGVVVAAAAGDDGIASTSIARIVMNRAARVVKQRAQRWAESCRFDLRVGVREALNATLELAGVPGGLAAADLEEDPTGFLASLPDRVRHEGCDLAVYPLHPAAKQARRSTTNFERFWAFGLGAQSATALLDSKLIALLGRWLLAMTQAAIRSVRHTSTLAALAVAGALGHHHQALSHTQETLRRQLEASGGGSCTRRAAQVRRDLVTASASTDEMHRARTQLLETTVPSRSRDVSDIIRLCTLSEMERLMKQDAGMFLQNKWTARVFLMIHDPSVEVRLKAVGVIHQWYAGYGRRSEAVQEHLSLFAQRCLSHLVERTGDVDARVAVAALRCLRLSPLAERLQDEEFDTIVNLCIGSQDRAVREESALFINAHVFQDPGICALHSPRAGRSGSHDAGAPDSTTADNEADGQRQAVAPGPEAVKEPYNSETSLSMLVEYLENYVGEHLRITDRAVSAFWGHAPALAHWGTMVSLCLVGETPHGVSLDPMSSRQRLALLYVMEATVRMAAEDVQNARLGEKEAAVAKLDDACTHILPELPRLLGISRPEEQQSLLLSHICKMLLEYAVENSHSQVSVNVPAMCQALRQAIEAQAPLDTTKYCTDALLALARCFDEAKTAFLDLAKLTHRSCLQLLSPGTTGIQTEDLKATMGRFVILSNRGIDMTFGSIDMLNSIMALLRRRVEWMEQQRAAESMAAIAASACAAADNGAGSHDAAAEQQERPAGVPDARLALQLLEAAVTAVMWHVQMAFWVESQAAAKAPGDGLQVSEMLHCLAQLPTVRAELPRAVSRLRLVSNDLVAADRNPYVRFHAYSAYMCLLQLAVGVSEKISLEVPRDGERASACSLGGTYEVCVPEPHMRVLWEYLNACYSRLSDADTTGLAFNSEGHRVSAMSVHPAPSQGTMTSVRFLTQQCLQAPGCAEDDHLDRQSELFLVILASRAVLESELEDVYTGPLGLLLLTQCERSRPAPLQEVALGLLRRLRELARCSEDLAVQFYRMQEAAVNGLFECSGIDAAAALSAAFSKHAGPRMAPWRANALFLVLKDAVLGCVTEDGHRLPLLEVFGSWFKGGFLQEAQCREISGQLRQRCASLGLEAEAGSHVAKFLRRLLSPGPPSAEAAKFEEGCPAALEVLQPSGPAEQPAPVGKVTHRLSSKRRLPESEVSRVPGSLVPSNSPQTPQSAGSRVRKSARTEDAAERVV